MIILLFWQAFQVEAQLVKLTTQACPAGQYFSSLSFSCASCPGNTVALNGYCQCRKDFITTEITTCQAKTYCVSDTGAQTTSACSCTNHAFELLNGQCQFCPFNSVAQSTGCGCSGSQVFSDGRCVAGTYTAAFASVIGRSIGPKASVGCITYGDQASCQQLINLCALTLSQTTYSASNTVCSIIPQAQQVIMVPATKGVQLIQNTPLNLQINFKTDRTDSLAKAPLYVIEYYLDGSVSKLKPLQNQFQLCSNSYRDAERSSRYGVDFNNDCDVDLTKYTSQTFYKTIFYELFLRDTDGTYVKIPVVTYDVTRANNKFNPYDYGTFEFVYRFFMIDNQQSATEIYYAKDFSVNYFLSTESSEKTFLPFIHITYSRLTYSATSTPAQNTVRAHYADRFFQSATNFYSVAGGILIAMIVIVLIMWVIKMSVWSKRNPPYVAEATWIIIFFVKAFFCLLDTWSEASFYFLFFLTGYWFCFFKFQQTVFVLMPTLGDYDGNYRQFEIIFYIMFACRLLTLLNMIANQSEMEVFFIDWEKSEVRRPVSLDDQLDPSVKQIISRYETKKSAWRTLLIANEFNELQVYRTVSVEWTIFFVGFFLEGLNWHKLASQQPNLELDSQVRLNYVLEYFICCFLYLAIGLVQIVVQKIFDIWFPIQVEDFVDLCSIANVSIMILDDALHGYYIHGENPIGVAEGSSEHLAQCLYYEAQGKGKKRGLVQEAGASNTQDTELQTFEIFVPLKFRQAYDQVFKLALRQSTDRAQYGGYGEMYQILRNPVPEGLDMKEVEMKRNVIQYYIKDVLSHIRNNFHEVIRDKLPLQRFLSYPPTELEDPDFKNQNIPVFFRDPDQNFKKVFFCGHEFFFLVTDTIMFNFWMLLTSNVYLSIILTYLMTTGVFHYRAWLGERNLSDQSKIDQRFLI